MERFRKLFEPIRIGNLEIKNRVVMSAMGIRGLTNPDGGPGQRALDYYIERARGGVGLIITGVVPVDKELEPLKNFGLNVCSKWPALAG